MCALALFAILQNRNPQHWLYMQDGSSYRVVLNAAGSSSRQALLEWITKEED